MRILFWLAPAMGSLCSALRCRARSFSSVLVWCAAARSLRRSPAEAHSAGAAGGREKERTPCGESAPHPARLGGGVLVVSDCQCLRVASDDLRMDAPVLLDDLCDHARADRATALPDGESQALVHGDRLNQLDLHLDVVAGHDHLDAVGQLGHAGDVGGAEVELRPVAREEGGVTAALLLLEHVDLRLELG